MRLLRLLGNWVEAIAQQDGPCETKANRRFNNITSGISNLTDIRTCMKITGHILHGALERPK